MWWCRWQGYKWTVNQKRQYPHNKWKSVYGSFIPISGSGCWVFGFKGLEQDAAFDYGCVFECFETLKNLTGGERWIFHCKREPHSPCRPCLPVVGFRWLIFWQRSLLCVQIVFVSWHSGVWVLGSGQCVGLSVIHWIRATETKKIIAAT